jgi:hypothetical protein
MVLRDSGVSHERSKPARCAEGCDGGRSNDLSRVQGGLGIVRVVEEVKHVFDFFYKKGLKLIQTPNHGALSVQEF